MRLTSILLLFIFLFLYSCSLDNKTIAKVGKLKIPVDDFKKVLAQGHPNKENYQDLDKKKKMDRLDPLILRELKLNAAYDAGLDKDKEILKAYDRQEGQMISDKYFETVIVDPLLPEDRLHKEFERSKYEVKVSHILISKRGGPNGKPRTDTEALKLAEEVAEQAHSGKDFAKLAKQYSDDTGSKQSGGELGYFGPGRMVKEFEEAAFSMKVGEISDPVKTQYGYHIIKLEDRRENPNFKEDNFKSQENSLKHRLFNSIKDTALTMWRKHLEELKEKYHFKTDDENVKKLVTLNQEKFKAESVKPESYTSSELDMPLLEWNDGRYTVNNLFDDYDNQLEKFKSTLTNQTRFQRALQNISTNKLIKLDASEIGIDTDSAIVDNLKRFLEYQMLSKVEKLEVNDKATYTDEDLKKYYAENQSEFTLPPSIEIWEIDLKTETQAKKIMSQLRAGKKFEILAKQTGSNIYAKKGGYIGFRQKGHFGAITDAAFKVGENALAGPVKYRNKWSVIKTGKMKPETVKSFEDSRTTLERKVKTQKMAERRKTWEEELRKKYNVTINEDLLASI